MMENADALEAVHKNAAGTCPERGIEGALIPMHPGAERYYKEVGVAGLIPNSLSNSLQIGSKRYRPSGRYRLLLSPQESIDPRQLLIEIFCIGVSHTADEVGHQQQPQIEAVPLILSLCVGPVARPVDFRRAA